MPAVAETCQRAEQGRAPLDPETLLGEIDWAVRHEDCLAAQDFFLRRTDLGYGPRERVASIEELALARLAERLGWDSERLDAERDDLERALAALHAWRLEVPASAGR
jgi:glycerol-3-phosphate dehydrogenase